MILVISFARKQKHVSNFRQYAKLILCYSERKEVKECEVEVSISEMKGAENRRSWKILSGRIERGRKTTLSHCLPGAQGMGKIYLFLKR